jgi:Cache 3/Cache 2 fusion domain
VVDELQKEKGGVATFFVKSGDEYVRVATNVVKADGSRAIGTILDPKGKVIEAIREGKSYYGDADILGKAYVTGYEPIRDAKSQVIGIFFVGYTKAPPTK